MEKIVLFQHAVETLGYFSMQLAAALEQWGMDCYVIDHDDLYGSLSGLSDFAVREHTTLLTFNFIGLSGEDIFQDERGHAIWERYRMRYINILVDHPLYYHTKLAVAAGTMAVFCVDREHVAYVRRFYPGVDVHFLPLAGNLLPGGAMEPIPYEKRRYGLVFTANYVALDGIREKIEAMEPDYAAFYRDIIDDLLDAPKQSVDAVMERHIREEIGAVSEADLCGAMSGMVLIDLYVRSYYRGKIIRTLAEAGIPVHLFGADWHRLPCSRPENLLVESGQTTSEACVRAIRDARISLNIMPWFKDGIHDRVLTSLLHGTLACTDGSRYLREEFADGEDLVLFSLQEIEKLPELAASLLQGSSPGGIKAGRIAENGYRKAAGRHTWEARAGALKQFLS